VDVQATAMGFEDLSLILSQGVHLRLLAMTAAFRATRNLQEIFGSGFAIVRIRTSQWRVTAGFRVYDKRRAIWRSNS
jgi:hypothetical protein